MFFLPDCNTPVPEPLKSAIDDKIDTTQRPRMRRDRLSDAKFFIPDAKTDSMARPRQDLRNDKIDTDPGESDAPRHRTKFSLPEASTLVRQDLPPVPKTLNPRVRERFRRTLNPETGPRTPEPRSPNPNV